jgi:iron complex outermembrane receptor protein
MTSFTQRRQLALAIATICASPMLWAQSNAATDVGRIAVEGAQGGTATGLLVQEDTPKARSSVTRAHMETLNPTANPYQTIELLPGVNTFSQDATGLFGGGMRVRGANSDQMGFTINGAPVNDSGNFAVYPMEYSDTENMCEIFVTQGSTDTEAPHVGASGGNVGMVTCSPKDKATVALTQTVGDLRTNRSFIRVDTGKFANDSAKAFISYSKATADKFKGTGSALKEHVDFGLEFKPNDTWFASTGFLWNKMYNNNFRTLTKAQIAATPTLDYSTVAPKVATATAAPSDGYYVDNINPFLNLLWNGKLEYKASKDTSFSAEPYYWYGHGTGGGQLQTLNENAASTLIGGGIGKDLNGNGVATNTSALVYGSGVTETYRPGITLKTNTRWGNNDILAGYWYEQARHIQTAPREVMNSSAIPADPWQFNSDSYILQQNGQPVMTRNEITISTASSLFVQDSINLMDDKLTVQGGLRNAEVKRDFTNFANLNGLSSTGAIQANSGHQGADYSISKTYTALLPSLGLRYRLDGERQVFANVAQNMRAPSNFTLEKLLVGGSIVNGVVTGATLRNPTVEMETSTNLDVGYRIAKDAWTFSGSVYYIDFNNRIATSYNPSTNLTTDVNVGRVVTNGFELESGYQLNSNWSVYGSMSYTSSKMQNDIPKTSSSSTNAYEATSGKQMPDTPEWMSGLSVAYKDANWYGNLDLKYTGQAFSTLVNDEAMGDYAVVNVTAGYRFADSGFFKKPSIQMNIMNLFDTNYLRINSPSGSNYTTRAQGAGGSAPSYFVSAPLYLSVTLRSEF